LIASGIVGATALGLYGLRNYRLKAYRAVYGLRDPDFHKQNLPLYHEEAKIRDKILSNVNYDLVLNLNPKKSDNSHVFNGRAKI